MKLVKCILAVGAAAAICASTTLAGGSARWDPYLGAGQGGWQYYDQYGQSTGSSAYDPYLGGGNGGYQFYDQYGGSRGTATWDPYSNSWQFGQ